MRRAIELALLPKPRRLFSRGGACAACIERSINLDVHSGIPQEVYRLRIAPDAITITADDDAGAFHGELTLRQIRRQHPDTIPACEFEDWPDFSSLGVLLYISGGKVPKMESLFALVDEFAEWKINHLELGIEHTFAHCNHRDVWADEVRRLWLARNRPGGLSKNVSVLEQRWEEYS